MSMESFFVNAKNPEKEEKVRNLAEGLGFVYEEDNPDFVISVGGDGTYLVTEREWPGVPKLLVRDSMVCFKCHDEPVEDVLEKVSGGSYRVVENIKLKVDVMGEELLAVNDVVMRNRDVRRGVRFKVGFDGDESGLLIGDGVVIATPFGSSGYYRSITRDTFDSGIGVAFNNTTVEKEPRVLDEGSTVRVEVVRGEAEVSVDNHPEVFKLDAGSEFFVERSGEKALLLTHE